MHTQDVIGILLALTALASYINYRFVKLPKSIGHTLITVILSSCIAFTDGWGWKISEITHELLYSFNFDEAFLHGMLGCLLFAGSLHVNTIELNKHKSIVALLATVSVVLSTFIVGSVTYMMTHYLDIALPLSYCLVFGALISPTDPIAVLSILKTAQAPKSLEIKIAGEALFNDGMGIVLFVILVNIATGVQANWTPSEITLFFLQQKVGGILLGALLGWLTANLLKNIEDADVSILLTLALVTAGYGFSHHIMHVSGAICLATAGLVVGSHTRKGTCSPETLRRVDGFWEVLDAILNSILFVIIGLECLRLSITWVNLKAALGVIVITVAARYISVAIPVGWLSMFRRYRPSIVLLMTWGGLRGGISIALALSLPAGPIRDFIITITYAVVLFSITVQGLTMQPLVRKILNSGEPFDDELQVNLVTVPVAESPAIADK